MTRRIAKPILLGPGIILRLNDEGRRVVEVPVEVWERLNDQGRGRSRVAATLRALDLEQRRRQALIDLQDGLTAQASAHDLGVSVRTIQRWRRERRVLDGRRRIVENPMAAARGRGERSRRRL